MHGAFRNNEDLAFGQLDCAFTVSVADRDVESSVEDEEELVGVLMAVPHVLAKRVGDANVIVVHSRHDARAVHLTERTECPFEIDWISSCHEPESDHAMSGWLVRC